MPQYDVTTPDGKTYTVNAPAGATQDDAISYVQSNFYQGAKADTTTKTDRLVKGLRDPIDGGAQLLTNMLPEGIVKAGNRANNWLADKTGLVGRLPEGGVDQQVREGEAAYQQARGEQGGTFDPMRVVGNVVNPANLALASKLPQAASILGRMGVGAAGGAVSGALRPATGEGDFADEKATQIGLGAAFGGAVPAITGAAGRVISPSASTNPHVQLLRSEGVTPTIGQALGGRLNTVEEKLMSVPILGDGIASARGRALEQFNNAAINRSLAPIGQKVEGTGQEAVKKAGDLISGAYDAAKSAMGAFKIDQQATAELGPLRMLARSGLEGRERKAFESYFQDYLRKPALTAESFKELDSKLAKDIGKFGGSNDAYQQKLGDALTEVRRIVTDNASRANPQAADAMKKADAAYARLVRVEGASKAGMNNEGVFTPAQLNMAARQSDRSVRDRATSRGTALMQDIGTAGQQVLGSRVPNSGTADRMLLNMGALGSAALHPAIPAGLLAGGALYTRPMAGLLSGAVTARPQSAQAIAEALRQASPSLIPLGSQVGLGLMN